MIDPMWADQHVQTLQQNRKQIKYFPVRKPHLDSSAIDNVSLIRGLIDEAKEQYKKRHLERHLIVNDESGKDSPWLNHTRWKRMFTNIDMTKLVAMTQLAIADEEVWLGDMERQVSQTIEDAYLGTSLN
jgi:hypothetical protein